MAKRTASGVLRGLEVVGVHVLPRHFYSPVADRRWLRAHPALWRQPAPMAGIHWDLDEQLAWLATTCADHVREVARFGFLADLARLDIPFRYGLIEAQVLHCFIRQARPGRIVEVGSGASTAIMAAAVRANGSSTPMVAVDPFAGAGVGRLGGVEIVGVGALEAEPAIFSALGAGDLLFIDSSHALKTGSELVRLYLEIIPRLARGVIVHIHDTYLPYLYSPWVLEDLWDWQETSLLAALLTSNAELSVLCAQSALHHARPEGLARVLPDYVALPTPDGIVLPGARGHFPSSTWLIKR